MKPKFNLRLRPKTKHQAASYRGKINLNEQILAKAVEYCKQNNCRGYKAVKQGGFNVDPRTINRILDGANIGENKSHLSILTSDEENSIVLYAKNKNRCLQGITKKELSTVILNTLKYRMHANKTVKNHRLYRKLSPNAVRAINTSKLSRSFWSRFMAKHPSLTQKRQGTVSMNRALNCTRAMAENHLNELAEELSNAGIRKNCKKSSEGVWHGVIDTKRVFNHDETPQFVNYGVDGSASGLVFAGKGDSCNQMIRENRDCVTIHPLVSCAGDVVICHIILSGKGITSKMAPKSAVEKITNLLVSTTEHGVQDHNSLLDFYKFFDQKLTEQNVERPVVVLTDGHSSRFDISVLQYCREKQIRLFVGPPDTTGVTQLLDQVNHSLHHHYRQGKSQLFSNLMTIDRSEFMEILGEVWSSWTSKEALVKAAKVVGIAESGLSVNWMQQDKFEQAERCLSTCQPTPTPIQSSSSKAPLVSSPQGVRSGSREYYKKKLENAYRVIHDLTDSPLPLEDVPGLLPYSRVTPKDITKKNHKSNPTTWINGRQKDFGSSH